MSRVDVFQRTVQTLQPAISDLFFGPTAGRWLVAVNVPVLRDGALRYVLSASLRPDGLGALLATAQIPAESSAMVIDRRGIVVAGTREGTKPVGKPVALGALDLVSLREDIVVRTGGRGSAYTAVSRAPWSRFLVALSVPADGVDASLRRSLWRVLGAALAAFGASRGLAFLAGRAVTRRLAGLSRILGAFGRGEPLPDPPKYWVSEFRGVSRAVREALGLLQAKTAALQTSQAALAASEVRYRRLIEESAEGIVIHHADVIRLANPAAARLLGYDRPTRSSARRSSLTCLPSSATAFKRGSKPDSAESPRP